MRVTVVGSVAPSTYLPRGEVRGPVELTDELRKLIRYGYVDVVEYHVDSPPAGAEPEAPKIVSRRKRPAGGSGQAKADTDV